MAVLSQAGSFVFLDCRELWFRNFYLTLFSLLRFLLMPARCAIQGRATPRIKFADSNHSHQQPLTNHYSPIS